MGNAEQPSRRRGRVLVVVAIAAAFAIAVVAVAATVFVLPTVRSLFPGTTADCFTTVNAVAKELRITSAGRVLSTATQDTGSFNDCSAPQYNATLDGTTAATTLESRLAADGFERQIPGVWQRTSDSTRVRIAVEGGETQVVIDVV